ncbi:MAG: CBS domain-containing protein [Limnochordia bacterium]|jgi:CBS domain-containing protein
MFAKDLMTEAVTTVEESALVEEASRMMAETGVSGLPVVDGEGKMVGMITERDLLRRTQGIRPPTFVPVMGAFIYLEHPERFAEDFKKAASLHVKDVMTTDVVSVEEGTPLVDIARIMVEQDINRVPVLRDGKLMGIVARADVIRALLGS